MGLQTGKMRICRGFRLTVRKSGNPQLSNDKTIGLSDIGLTRDVCWELAICTGSDCRTGSPTGSIAGRVAALPMGIRRCPPPIALCCNSLAQWAVEHLLNPQQKADLISDWIHDFFDNPIKIAWPG